jgi:hypothetical protein
MVILAFRERALEQRDDPITVAILGGDRVAGQALELLLQGVGCDARFVADPVAEGAGEWLDRVQVVLLPPTLRPEHREALLAGMGGAPGTSGVPIIELVDAPREGPGSYGRYVLLWPSRVEELMQAIEAAVADQPEERSAANG